MNGVENSKSQTVIYRNDNCNFFLLQIDFEFFTNYEKPGEMICATAKEQHCDYIVMGTRGMGKLRRTILGSVSDFVVHHAHIPVLVARKD